MFIKMRIIVLCWIFSPFAWGEMATLHQKEETLKDHQSNWTIIKDNYGKRISVLDDDSEVPVKPIEFSSTDADVRFYLYTRRNPTQEQELKTGATFQLKHSNWDRSQPVKICIHGFIASFTETNQQKLKSRLLDRDNFNVILVDWSALADNIIYPKTKGKAVAAGTELAKFIDFLVETVALSPKDIHIIGHSLGAHVAGFASNIMNNGPVGRISGLDPAKPGFTHKERIDRLNSDDADFVDCIHTCGGFLGFKEPICDADFYPNGGTSVQPGCHWYDFGVCSHTRSYELFIESTIADHKFKALKCNSIPSKKDTDCTNPVALMGYPASPKFKGMYFLETNDEFPFVKN